MGQALFLLTEPRSNGTFYNALFDFDRIVKLISFVQCMVFHYFCYRMPTILRIKGYRFFFFSNERAEPIHIHIEKAECYAKFWLDPLFVCANHGFTSKELREISEIVDENETYIREKWDEHFSK